MSTQRDRIVAFAHYRDKAFDAAAEVERLSNVIRDYAAKTANSLGANGRSAVVSQQLSKDIPFLDVVSDRNRYIQLSIMYSNLAQLLRDPPS